MTSMAVVLEVGARERAGFFGTWTFRMRSLWRASADFKPPVQRNDFYREALDRGEQVEQFIRFTGITQGEDDVAVVDDAEVAVEGVHAVEDDTGRAGAGSVAAISRRHCRFADTDNDNFAAPAEGFADEGYGGVKGLIELGAHGFERGEFDVEYLAGFGQMTPRARMRGVGGTAEHGTELAGWSGRVTTPARIVTTDTQILMALPRGGRTAACPAQNYPNDSALPARPSGRIENCVNSATKSRRVQCFIGSSARRMCCTRMIWLARLGKTQVVGGISASSEQTTSTNDVAGKIGA